MPPAYPITDHEYDVVVVGAGGAGLRATLGTTLEGLKTACITKVFPTRSHTVAAQGGIAAALGNMSDDDWRWHMYDTVKGSDWLGDQDAIEYMCRQAIPAVIELEHFGVPFSRTESGQIYQRPFGGHMMEYGEGAPANRACAAADRTGHAILHTLYQQSLRHNAEFFVEYFALDLIMDEEGVCRGVMAWNLADGTIHRFRAAHGDPRHRRVRPHLFHLHLGAYLHRRRQRDGAARRAAAAGHGIHPVPPDRHLRRRLPDHRGRPRRGRLPDQQRGRALHGALCAACQGPGLARRGQPGDDGRNPRGRGCGPDKDHILLHLEHLDPKVLHQRLPGISETAKIFANVDVTREPIPILPTVHYNMGGIPTNYRGEVLRPTESDPDAVAPGLMAIGEGACVSVHGANRLGCNSLLDIVVFGRAAAHRAAELVRPGMAHAPLPDGAGENAVARLDAARQAKGERKAASIRTEMQRVMQNFCPVFRTGEVMKEGVDKIDATARSYNDVGVTDRSLIWNSDLVEALELKNLLEQAVVPCIRPRTARKAAAPMRARISPSATT